MELLNVASSSSSGGLPPGLIVLIVGIITIPVAVVLGLVEWRARHGSWPWKDRPKNHDR
jgi:hypothetical protein